jgi:hypothetical protein
MWLDHPKWLRIELGRQKTLEFPFWAKGVVVKKGSWLKIVSKPKL